MKASAAKKSISFARVVFDQRSVVGPGLNLYCEYHAQLVKDKKLHGEDGCWDEYADALGLMANDLSGGHWQRCHDQLVVNLNRKRRDDLAKLKKFPPAEHRQEAVHKSFLIMMCIGKAWGEKEAMPRSMWGLLNVCAAGAIYNSTHGGRKMEWETLVLEKVEGVLAHEVPFFTCEKHKTWASYGDLAKWVPPCLLKMFTCYLSCPRPADVTTFFVPAQAGAPTMSFPSALRTWSKRFLDAKYTWPTVNDYRKFSHRVLMKLTENHQRLKDVLKVIDAHSKHTQDRHYILREPEEDAKLGELLSKQVHGDPGPQWPTDDALTEAMGKGDDLGRLLQDIAGGRDVSDPIADSAPPSDDEGDDCDNEDMEWWDVGGAFFKVPQQDLVPICAPEAELQVITPGEQETPALAQPLVEPPQQAASASSGEPREQPAPKRPRHTLSKEEKEYYQQWLETKGALEARQRSSEATKKWMRDELRAWQNENGKGELAKPDDGPRWYYDTRIKGIQKGHFLKSTDKNIVKSYVESYINNLLEGKAETE